MQSITVTEAIQHTAPLILDGAMGSMRLSQGTAYNPVTIHRSYLEAGAQIITADTVGCASAAFAVRNNGPDAVSRICRQCDTAMRAACAARSGFYSDTRKHTAWIAGSLGPVAMHGADASEPDLRALTDIYCTLVQCMAAGGADLILIETAVSAQQAEAAAQAASIVAPSLPVVISATTTVNTDKQLIPQIAAIAESYTAIAAGLNCVEADASHFSQLRQMASLSALPAIFYPSVANRTTPHEFAKSLSPLLKHKQLGIIGGCCGTTPAHISALAAMIARSDVLGDAKI